MEKVTAESKKQIFAEYGGKETNTGSIESQVALFTARIKYLTEHVKKNRKDYANTKALTTMVGKRRKLLKYMERKDVLAYRELVKKLGLRRWKFIKSALKYFKGTFYFKLKNFDEYYIFILKMHFSTCCYQKKIK